MDCEDQEMSTGSGQYYDPVRDEWHDIPPKMVGPVHYTRLIPEPIDVILAWKLEYAPGSAVKYIARAGFKEGASAESDYQKAINFLNYQIAVIKGKK